MQDQHSAFAYGRRETGVWALNNDPLGPARNMVRGSNAEQARESRSTRYFRAGRIRCRMATYDSSPAWLDVAPTRQFGLLRLNFAAAGVLVLRRPRWRQGLSVGRRRVAD